jgi:AcrR family transcriptional regulator
MIIHDPMITQQLPRRERERLMRRKEIIDAAREVFARKGFNEATLDDVAERAEFGKGTLYNYFPNKEALFASVIEDCFASMKRIAEEAFGSNLTFSEKVERFVRDELSFFFNNLEGVQLMMREAHHMRLGNPLMQLMPQLLAIVSDTIGAEQRRRRVISNAEPIDLAMILLNMLYGQFASRIYRRAGVCMEHPANPSKNDINIATVFGGISKEEIEREVDAATKLIHTVYFQGIGK